MKRSSDESNMFAKALRHHQTGEIREAISLYRRILAAGPAPIAVSVNLGSALISLNAFEEAEAVLKRAVNTFPESADARNNFGIALEHQSKLNEAIVEYRNAIALSPGYADASFNLGNALARTGRLDEAIVAFHRTLEIKPDHVDARFNLGNVCLLREDFDGASLCYREVIAARPLFAKAYQNLATAYSGQSRVSDAFAAYSRYAELTAGNLAFPASPHLTLHNNEQEAHLTAMGTPAAGSFRLTGGSRLPGPAVNSANAGLADGWQALHPQILVVDNFLTEPALVTLRRFCWESTVWRRPHRDGYIGALPEDGFACPLLAQIAEELPRTFPTIFGEHHFRRLAGFKYTSRGSGLSLHADNAAVNVNFWITADSANLDPQSGGILIWDVPAPPDWAPRKFNGDANACREFLKQTEAGSVTIPHRANRAVVFDSDLFHETDQIAFRDRYVDRRISISMLYGDRG